MMELEEGMKEPTKEQENDKREKIHLSNFKG